MASTLMRKIFGSRNDRQVKKYRKVVNKINNYESDNEGLSDEQLGAKTVEYRERFNQGESLDDLLPEAFATVREASKRVLGMRHFDVQMIGGIVLHNGNIAEMRTGEGKTLVATLATYLNALSSKGVHVITVNDYLAQRDAGWMGKLYAFLGLSTGVVISGMEPLAKKQAYESDITYGTNNEFGFDYLRDNMAFSVEEKVQRELNFAVVDEVDSILIDEARTPLIISGPTNDNSELYVKFNGLIKELEQGEEGETKEEEPTGDYTVDEKNKSVAITEQGHEKVEELLIREGILDDNDSLYSATNINLIHYLTASIRANVLFQKDVSYIVSDGKIVIVDEFTGRTMEGRRWSDGLHQAIEAKEGVNIENENQTLAGITFQNYFRLYNKLAGMTGTADTEAFEFQSIYNLEVMVIPTNLDVARVDNGDLIFLTVEEKFNAIAEDVKDCIERKQPVLVGTASIEASEHLSELLTRLKVKHNVLNAKQHEREAGIIAEAGVPGAVTIATNMAGRGTDIVLGGNLDVELAEKGEISDSEKEKFTEQWQERHEAVLTAGGLHVIGSERHESRRIDNQLRGRSGRQGDAGSTRFYLSLQDDLMRIFASDKMSGLMKKLGMEEGEAIEHPWVSRAIENAQRKVEGHNFDIRKQLLEYDDVANDQRKVVYQQRNEMMAEDDLNDIIESIRADVINTLVSNYVPAGTLEEQWDIEGLVKTLEDETGRVLSIQQWLDDDDQLNEYTLAEKVDTELKNIYKEKETAIGADELRRFEKYILLQVLDSHWKEHLAAMDYLRQSINLRAMAQKNPKQEYKRESFEMFTEMLEQIKQEVMSTLARVEIRSQEEIDELERQQHMPMDMSYEHADASMATDEERSDAEKQQPGQKPFVRNDKKIGRNDPCYCGSGKKFKQCHGKLS
ncbi:MAG: preprotein translocase subunit SecA [endosymbiont of Galathealinum brachiosum]|uniref:Protein translocase subunit SecA n=1 Tax=endosymbiont of Galathealinum brachiosum TaxID=2200906 RepID=A0A370D8V3_9GAMM|nr:MAG: preprotein translocase subunit SecA [endosymbiont of Galathealinum brachiosum]